MADVDDNGDDGIYQKKTATIKGIYAVVAALVRTYNRG